MLRKYGKNFTIIFLFLIISVSSLEASVIILKDGIVLTGRIKSESNNQIIFENKYGSLTIEKKDIESVIWDEKKIKKEKFNFKGKDYFGRLIKDTGALKLYLLDDGEVIRLKETRLAKSTFLRHLTRIEFRIKAAAMPGPVIDENSTGIWPTIDLANQVLFPVVDIRLAHYERLSPLFRYGFFFGYHVFERSLDSEKDNFSMTIRYRRKLTVFGLGFHMTWGDLLKRPQKSFISRLIAGAGSGINLGVQRTVGRITLVRSSFAPNYADEYLTFKSFDPNLEFYLSEDLEISRHIMFSLNFGFSVDFYRNLYNISNSQIEQWKQDPETVVFIPIAVERTGLPVNLIFNFSIGFIW